MTGYGKSVVKLPSRDITIEIKSLNSKQLDLSVRIPSVYSSIDGRIRSEIAQRIERGKVELTMRVENISAANGACVNIPVIKKYKEQIVDAANEIGATIPENWFEILLRMPEAITTEVKEANEEEEEAIMSGVIDKGIKMSDLKGTLEMLMKKLYGNDCKLRFRPHHFPFTEPSCEVDISCFNCGGCGCSMCKDEGYIELLGAGMVHPKVLENCGIDSTVYSGFAFGLGLERMVMGRYDINDLRLLYENDVRFLEQF